MAVSIHEEFSASDADVVFKSYDGIRFHLHRKNLEANTGAFPGPEFQTEGEVTTLAEPARVLQILFKFVYPRRHPDLENLDFMTVADVAEAAEKYEVFPAINTCITRLIHCIPGHSLEVLLHGIKHDYPKLINAAGPHLFFRESIFIAEQLPSPWVFPWLKYNDDCWDNTFGKAEKYIKARKHDELCHQVYDKICIGCRYSLYTWIDDLTCTPTLSAFHSALDTHKGYSKVHLCRECKSQCVFTQTVVDLLRKGLNSTPPLTTYHKQ